jgi:L-serine dehydratase
MESIKEIYKTGHGPSSSHTMGPRLAAKTFLQKNPGAAKYEVMLYGSLAATGLGHLTYKTIEEIFDKENLLLHGSPEKFLPMHSNAMRFKAYNSAGKLLDEWVAYSIGGGAIVDEHTKLEEKQIYPLHSMEKILEWCYENGKNIWEYVEKYEEDDIWDYLREAWESMKDSIRRGLDAEGTLPGKLKITQKGSRCIFKS